MSNLLILDTNVLIELERGNRSVQEQLLALHHTDHGDPAITTAVLAEFLLGVPKENDPRRAFADSFPVIPFDRQGALFYAQVGSDLREQGMSIPSMDLITASCALATSGTVITADEHFARVPGLKLVLLKGDE